MTNEAPLYNSRIFQTYLDYLRIYHPDCNIQEICDQSGMAAEEVADSAHWFTQQQADRFHDTLIATTGDKDISRKAGRFSASSTGLTLIKQYITGLLNTETALMAMAKLFPLMTRASTVEVIKIGPGKFEIIATPVSDVEEKPYQCENRLGIIEALPKLFSNLYGHIEHPACLHKGDGACRYIVSWDNPASTAIRLLRNYSLICSLLLAPTFYFFMSGISFLILSVFLLCLNAGLGFGYSHLKIKELEKLIESSRTTAEKRIENANIDYNNSLLVQEVGQATAAILNIDDLMRKITTLMEQRLDFDRSLIMLANENGTQLVYAAGFGYSQEENQYLQETVFHLDNQNSKGFFVRAFLDRQTVIIKNADEIADVLSARSRKLLEAFRVRSLLCIPILYKDASLGILAVDNVTSKAPFRKSDINLLQGIASHIAISINNARSFKTLQEIGNRYRQTLESIEEGYFEVDFDGRVTFVNKAFCQLIGLPLDRLPENAFERYFVPESAIRLDRLFEQMRACGESVHFAQLELSFNNGTTLPVDLSASLIVDHNSQAVGFRGLLRDARDRLNLENERRELEKKLLHSQKMESLGLLAGGIAHNFNNWLGGILGNVGMIRLSVEGQEKVIERIAKIENIIDNAAKMTHQLLGYARGGNYEKKNINLNTIIQEVSETFAAARKDVAIQLSLAPDLRTVKVDKSQIEQVLWNLYVNATDAMPEGGTFTIRTANANFAKIKKGRLHDIAPGKYVMLNCTDSGTGISPEHLDKIFEPFFTTKKSKGTGLGLASCFGIVKSHKGYIEASSQKGTGSTFTIYLPEAGVLQDFNEEHLSSTQKGHGTILIVDDEQMLREPIERLLSSLGYAVLCATSGEEALEKFAEHLDAIDIFIIDMIMPGMGGGELHTRITKLKPDAKTILCSGYAMNQRIQEIMDRGCTTFLQKPFNLAKLSETIKNISNDEKLTAERSIAMV